MANANSELLTRAIQETVPTKLAQEKIESQKKLRVYLGVDPTGTKLHLGHSVPLRKLQAFAEAGHHAIFLIGSYTAMIGDPTGRDAMRPAITKEEVTKNFETYKEQASKILDFTKVEIRYNDEWLGKLSAAETMKLSSDFTVQQILQRDMFKQRLKKEEDISLMEFLYPMLQGYDSVILDVDCEIGGSDQLFNMMCGRKLQQRYGKRDKFVLTTKLIEGIDGRKMSKTYDNCIYLTDEANDMYGKVMRVKDDLMEIYFECCTDVPMEDAKELLKGNPKEAKMRLAREIVTLYHGEKAAQEAEKEFQTVFSSGGVPSDIEEVKVKKDETLFGIIMMNKLASSKSEARRLFSQNAVSLNDDVVSDPNAKASSGVLRVGKRKFLKLNA